MNGWDVALMLAGAAVALAGRAWLDWLQERRQGGRDRVRDARAPITAGSRWATTIADLRLRGVQEIAGPFEIPGHGIFEVERLNVQTGRLELVALIGASRITSKKGGTLKIE